MGTVQTDVSRKKNVPHSTIRTPGTGYVSQYHTKVLLTGTLSEINSIESFIKIS